MLAAFSVSHYRATFTLVKMEPLLGTDVDERVESLFTTARNPDAMSEGAQNECYPIVCALSGQEGCLPAVKVVSPDQTFSVFPFSRAELGQVWRTTEEMWPWVERGGRRSWEEAEGLFMRLVDYPTSFLSAMLCVFCAGAYDDSQVVTSSNWAANCRAGRHQLAVDLCCVTCDRVHNGSLAWLNDCAMFGKEFTCCSLGLSCGDKRASLPTPRPPAASPVDQATAAIAVPREASPSTLEALQMPKTPAYQTWSSHHPDAHLESAIPSGRTFSCDTITQPDFITLPQTDLFSSPSHFATGRPAARLRTPDPSSISIHEAHEFFESAKWQKLVSSLMSWMGQYSTLAFEGKDDVMLFKQWRHSIEKFFQVWAVHNTVIQARLATITFRNKADLWWDAHVRLRPRVMVSFEQLIECMGRELVPCSLGLHSYLVWFDLEYKGDVTKYIEHLKRLMMQHPLPPTLAHALACRPLGRRLVAKICGMDDEVGGDGISLSQLKHQIRCFMDSELPTQPRPRHQVGVHAHFAAPLPTNTPQDAEGSSEASTRIIYWICGKRGHICVTPIPWLKRDEQLHT